MSKRKREDDNSDVLCVGCGKYLYLNRKREKAAFDWLCTNCYCIWSDQYLHYKDIDEDFAKNYVDFKKRVLDCIP